MRLRDDALPCAAHATGCCWEIGERNKTNEIKRCFACRCRAAKPVQFLANHLQKKWGAPQPPLVRVARLGETAAAVTSASPDMQVGQHTWPASREHTAHAHAACSSGPTSVLLLPVCDFVTVPV